MSKLVASALIVLALVFGIALGKMGAIPHDTGIIVWFKKILETPATAVALIAALFALLSGIGGPLVTLIIGKQQAAAARMQAAAAQTSANAAQTSANAAKTSADAAMATARSAGSRALANTRLEWLTALRDNLSEYHSILMTATDPDPDLAGEDAKLAAKKKADDQRRLSYLGTQLDLLLNQKKPIQDKLWKISDDILHLKTKKERQGLDSALVSAARDVLDFEWQKIKQEMHGGLS